MSTRRSGRASKPESSAAGGRQEWSVEEDDEVNRAVARLGKKAWAQVAEELNASGVTGPGCARTGKQVRARAAGRPTRAPPRVRVAVPGPAIAAARVPPAYSRAATAQRRSASAESAGFGLGARDGRQGAAEPERPAPPERGARRAAPGGRALRRRGAAPAAPAVGGGFSDGLAPPGGLMSPPGDSPSWNRATPHESPSWTGDKAADEAPWTGDRAPGPDDQTRHAQTLLSLFGQADVKLPSVDTFRSIWLSEAA
ncbi:RNA polymerase II transcription regulator recruiting protein [Aureococcus anophagefferens]|nr:RNA polymerase II transcription regulator recruiting protein [Aureococcus anophagefferens]